MEWILVLCTKGWLLCGQVREVEYPTESSCYRAMNELYRRHGHAAFKYVICRPKKPEDDRILPTGATP